MRLVSVLREVFVVCVDISQNTGISVQHVTLTLNLLRLASNKDTGYRQTLHLTYYTVATHAILLCVSKTSLLFSFICR